MPANNHQLPTTNRTPSRRLKVLISAYACEPGKGSEPGVGWNFSKEMATHHDVWVLTRSNNQTVIEDELAAHPVAGLNFFYHDLPKWACWWKKGGRGVQLYYYLWQLTAISQVRKKHAEVGFDVSHHTTFAKYWVPSCLAWLKIPFVWGPVGGAEYTPRALISTLGLKDRWYEKIKEMASRLGECDPLVRKTVRQASLVFASTAATKERLLGMGVPRVAVETQIGMTRDELAEIGEIEGPVCRFVSAGRLIYWKGFQLGLQAFSEIGKEKVEYWIIGDGPFRGELERYVQEHGLADKVRFVGSRSRQEVLDCLTHADALVHPSFHDSAGLICLEAMALGRPVLCLDTGGPAELVDESCGFKASVASPEDSVASLADAMRKIAGSFALRQRMGAAARKRVEEKFLWEHKVTLMANNYYTLLGKSS